MTGPEGLVEASGESQAAPAVDPSVVSEGMEASSALRSPGRHVRNEAVASRRLGDADVDGPSVAANLACEFRYTLRDGCNYVGSWDGSI